MKAFFSSLLLCSLFLIYNSSYCQVPAIVGQNIFKWNVSAVAISHYSFQYERVLGLNRSYAIGFGFSPEVSLPFKKDLLKEFGDNEDARSAIESTKFTKITVTPEFRFYINKNAPKGFYIAPFVRYTHMSIKQTYPFITINGVQHYVDMKGKFDGVGAGTLIGTQWTLGEVVTLDLWIAGPFIGYMNANFHGTDDMSDMTLADKGELKVDIESTDLPFWTVEATIGNNTVDAKLKGPFVGLRLAGFCVGFRF